MRRRAKRDLMTLFGVIAVIAGILVINTYMRYDDLKTQAAKWRRKIEAKHRMEGVNLLDWELLRETKGTLRSGPQFTEELRKKEGRAVNLVGFMAPIDQFTNVDEFMLLPAPISCYFCASPPPRHIVQVKLANKNKMVNEPVLIGGLFKLYEQKGSIFFQSIGRARFNEPVTDEDYTELEMEQAHKLHHQGAFEHREDGSVGLAEQIEELFPGEEPPKLEEPTHPGAIPAIDTGPLMPGAEPPKPESEDEEDYGPPLTAE